VGKYIIVPSSTIAGETGVSKYNDIINPPKLNINANITDNVIIIQGVEAIKRAVIAGMIKMLVTSNVPTILIVVNTAKDSNIKNTDSITCTFTPCTLAIS